MNQTLRIAVDFDGTIVNHDYPKIGEEKLFAFDTLKALQKKGHFLILFTYREGDFLKQAVDFCKKNGVVFQAVNESYEGERKQEFYNRKLDVDLFIDDRNIGGFLGWDKVWQLIHPEGGELNIQYFNPEAHFPQPKNWFFNKFFKK